MSITKGWDWSKNESDYWLIPSNEIFYLSERWKSKDFNKFLDLGCGLGRHSVFMAKKKFSVTAVDISEYGISHLQKWSKEERTEINTCTCNMMSLPFEDDSFDCMLAYNVIYHTDTMGFNKTLEEIKRVLKPGGEIYLTMLSKNTWSFKKAESYKKIDDNTILRDDHETEKDVPHFYASVDDLKELFRFWEFAQPPIEFCEYNLDNTEYYSKHWSLLLRNL